MGSSLLSPLAKTRLFAEPLIGKKKGHADESLFAFSNRRLGKEITQKLLMPFVSGVWAGRTEELSAQSTFPQLATFEENYGSLLKGAIKSKKKNGAAPYKKGLLSFKAGLKTLPQALSKSIGDSLHLNETIESVSFENNLWHIKTNKDSIQSERLVVSLPAYVSAALFNKVIPSTANALNDIPYVPLTVLHFSWPKKILKHH